VPLRVGRVNLNGKNNTIKRCALCHHTAAVLPSAAARLAFPLAFVAAEQNASALACLWPLAVTFGQPSHSDGRTPADANATLAFSVQTVCCALYLAPTIATGSCAVDTSRHYNQPSAPLYHFRPSAFLYDATRDMGTENNHRAMLGDDAAPSATKRGTGEHPYHLTRLTYLPPPPPPATTALPSRQLTAFPWNLLARRHAAADAVRTAPVACREYLLPRILPACALSFFWYEQCSLMPTTAAATLSRPAVRRAVRCGDALIAPRLWRVVTHLHFAIPARHYTLRGCETFPYRRYMRALPSCLRTISLARITQGTLLYIYVGTPRLPRRTCQTSILAFAVVYFLQYLAPSWTFHTARHAVRNKRSFRMRGNAHAMQRATPVCYNLSFARNAHIVRGAATTAAAPARLSTVEHAYAPVYLRALHSTSSLREEEGTRL